MLAHLLTGDFALTGSLGGESLFLDVFTQLGEFGHAGRQPTAAATAESEAWGDMVGATAPGIGEAAGAPAPGHGAGAPVRGASVGHGIVWAAAWHAGSTTTAK